MPTTSAATATAAPIAASTNAATAVRLPDMDQSVPTAGETRGHMGYSTTSASRSTGPDGTGAYTLTIAQR